MAENTTISTIITIIIIVLVLVVAVFGITKLNASGVLKELFPDFGKEDKVVWNEEFFLENPEEIQYCIQDEKNDICFRYFIREIEGGVEKKKFTGWEWSKNEKDWLSVSNTFHVNYKNLDSRNKEFIKQLEGKSPEKGLELIVNRVLENKGDSFLGISYDVDVVVKIGDKEESYEYGDKRLLDLDGLIDKLNQISRGVIRKREAVR